jgi:hypothetical protein
MWIDPSREIHRNNSLRRREEIAQHWKVLRFIRVDSLFPVNESREIRIPRVFEENGVVNVV